MFSYQPLSEQQCNEARFQLLKDGVYEAVVKKAEYQESKSGNPMFKLTLDVFDDKGTVFFITDYLVFTPQMMFKIKHFCDSADLKEEYESGRFCHPDLAVQRNVFVKIKTQKGKEIPDEKLGDKPKGSLYPDKNIVDDYVLIDKMRHKEDEPFNDEVPF